MGRNYQAVSTPILVHTLKWYFVNKIGNFRIFKIFHSH
jgi:hypothetical protein